MNPRRNVALDVEIIFFSNRRFSRRSDSSIKYDITSFGHTNHHSVKNDSSIKHNNLASNIQRHSGEVMMSNISESIVSKTTFFVKRKSGQIPRLKTKLEILRPRLLQSIHKL